MNKEEFMKKYEGKAMLCTTEKLANKFLKFVDSFDIKWYNGDSLINHNNWDRYKEDTCYILESHGFCFCDIKYAKGNYEIIEFKSLKNNPKYIEDEKVVLQNVLERIITKFDKFNEEEIQDYIIKNDIKKVNMEGVFNNLTRLKPIIEKIYDENIFYLSYWETDAPYFGLDLKSDNCKNMMKITDNITQKFNEIYALILGGIGELK